MNIKNLLISLSLSSVIVSGTASSETFPTQTSLPNNLVNPAQVSYLSGEDANKVRETVQRVYLAEDARNYDAFRHLLTKDYQQQHSIYGRLEGVETFINWLKSNPQAFDRYRHMALNTVTSAVGQGKAQAVSYLLVLDLHPAKESDARDLPRILAHGVVRDQLVKKDDRWLITHRIYDQFAVAAAVVADREVRIKASRYLVSE
ncbi:nuclear transport factor 2 family protein [Marinibactrum halimedae]|uniref:SnoaL-like domain-containing protein n=1 Tax=Marinibactrum halimedae TaxID=1444977 RepID=A0AA37WPZ3_9GAMM|nr:nuclear transport factor 2 family protein [Marinibactrum halimedae]MCD9459446.1 nuclear transport factor 2 family protein [Marinibactrum halimedae]GLS27486.1 hypothetical protein GCM10007877_32050 [Marinibactrum halimedae]